MLFQEDFLPTSKTSTYFTELRICISTLWEVQENEYSVTLRPVLSPYDSSDYTLEQTDLVMNTPLRGTRHFGYVEFYDQFFGGSDNPVIDPLITRESFFFI
ncbi:hypothetical protein CVT25_007899 [Psilocybe cyanescens]|uniref:Uncharacterized protein n=1 Tax=Psilocybe cyanescens TaxID=93625 RepID=A0A409XHT6_PSICY|nr:hypothetical protein CVT25_007899 [Psilocybe cyanescens]